MSLQIRDTITPALAKAISAVKNPAPILEAMGQQLVSITKRAFSDSSLRAMPWPARKKPAPHQLLRKSGALVQSIRITEVSQDHVTAGADRVYAAIQQLGSAKKTGRGSGIPPRPFFPFYKSGKMTPLAARKIEAIAMDKLAKLMGK